MFVCVAVVGTKSPKYAKHRGCFLIMCCLYLMLMVCVCPHTLASASSLGLTFFLTVLRNVEPSYAKLCLPPVFVSHVHMCFVIVVLFVCVLR